MKNLFFLLISASLLTLMSCDKDEDCNPGSLETNIVGEWNVTITGLPLPVVQVEFRANGDLVDQSGVLVEDVILGMTVESKTYSVPSDTIITLTASNSLGSLDYNVDVVSYTCDEIIVIDQGTEYTLKRRE